MKTTPEQRSAIASAAGKRAHAVGRAHQFNTEEARAAGRIGGRSIAQDRIYMTELGRRGSAVRFGSPASADEYLLLAIRESLERNRLCWCGPAGICTDSLGEAAVFGSLQAKIRCGTGEFAAVELALLRRHPSAELHTLVRLATWGAAEGMRYLRSAG